MKVLYDYTAFFNLKYGGIPKCFVELIKHFPLEDEAIVAIKESDNIYLKESNLIPNLDSIHWKCNKFILPFPFKGQRRLLEICKTIGLPTPYSTNMRYAIDLIKKGDYNVFHPTGMDDYFLPYLHKKPFVITIHDMIPELLKNGDSNISRVKRKLAQKSSHIIAVSENTKADIIKLWGIPEEKITVIYHAAEKVSFGVNNLLLNKINLPNKFFLYIGKRSGYKSFKDFLIQTSLFFQQNRDVYLLCTGSPFTKEEMILIEKLKLTSQLKSYFFTTEQLMYTYSKAIAFIFPSKYEGFGIPILEAFAMKCPVLLNNTSCFPEIAKDAALYFNLEDNTSCLHSLETIYNMSPNERMQLVQKGTERFKNFSWEKSAKQLVDVYKSII